MKRYRKDRNITWFMMALVIIAYVLKNALLIGMGGLYTGIVLVVLLMATFIGLVLPLFNGQAFMEFTGWMLLALIALFTMTILVVLQMIFDLYSANFYTYVFDALAIIAISLALWQNHEDFVKTNRDRQRRGTGSAVMWTGLSLVTVKGFMIAYKDKKKKK